MDRVSPDDGPGRGVNPRSPDGKHLNPLRAHGIEVMSIGFMIDAEQPMAWRGPMVTQALSQLLGENELGRARLPGGGYAAGHGRHSIDPGTACSGERRGHRDHTPGHRAFGCPQGTEDVREVEVRCAGAWWRTRACTCAGNCGHAEHTSAVGGGARMAEQYGVKLLDELPLDIRIREEADGGAPTVVADRKSAGGLPHDGAPRRRTFGDLEQRLQLGVPQDLRVEADP